MTRAIRIFQIDAFVTGDGPFSGNPAAVCPLDEWVDDRVMQQIAAENNLAETAFFVGGDSRYHIRWFTPALEIDLCGHATLASAAVVFDTLEKSRTRVVFDSQSGPLSVERAGERLELDFPARPPQPCEVPGELLAALGGTPQEVLAARDYFLVYGSEAEVRALRPDFARLRRLDRLGVIATAPGAQADFVSRFFAPNAGVDEDPATGSAHCTLIPYWSRRIGKTSLFAHQASARGAALWCADRGDRVGIAGRTVTYLEGTIHV